MLRALLWLCLACVALPERGFPEQLPPYLAKDMTELKRLRTGLWSTDRQVFFWSEAGYPDEQPESVMEWHVREDEKRMIVSQRMIRGSTGSDLAHVFNIGGDVIEERIGEGGCLIRWQRRAGGFLGLSDAGQCLMLGSGSVEMFLTPKDLEVRAEGHSPQMFRRARMFICWAAVLRGAAHGDSGEGMSDWDFRQGLTLHDQGGEVMMVSDETPPRVVRLRLRDVDWPYGERRGSLTLYVLEGEVDRALSYAWTGAGEDRIGINLRWLQASCTYEGATP